MNRNMFLTISVQWGQWGLIQVVIVKGALGSPILSPYSSWRITVALLMNKLNTEGVRCILKECIFCSMYWLLVVEYFFNKMTTNSISGKKYEIWKNGVIVFVKLKSSLIKKRQACNIIIESNERHRIHHFFI